MKLKENILSSVTKNKRLILETLRMIVPTGLEIGIGGSIINLTDFIKSEITSLLDLIGLNIS